MIEDFLWRDGDRVIVFRRGAHSGAARILAEHGLSSFELLTTERALAGAPDLAAAARAVHLVAPGGVPEAAAAILDRVGTAPLVALGGGRSIDSAKAVAAVTGAPVAALATTMSGAEMTGIHRLPAGAEDRVRGMVRPRLVIADPEAMTSQSEQQLRSSSMNALAHGADSLATPFANPVSRMTALRGAADIAAALDQPPASRDRPRLALGSLLCGYAIDSAMFGLHHVVCQTLVRVCGSPHAETNAAILPGAMAAMRGRAPERIAELAVALDTTADEIDSRIRDLAGDNPGLGAAGADRSRLDEALDAMLARPELGFTPDPPDRAELRQLVEAAW